MNRDIEEIIATLDAISSVEDEQQLKVLQRAIDSFFLLPKASKTLGVWFQFFERFPDKDGYGVFWSILHNLEAQPGYEAELLDSLRRSPSQFPLLMVNRMLNAGQFKIGGVDLKTLLQDLAQNHTAMKSVRDAAQKFLDYQVKKS